MNVDEQLIDHLLSLLRWAGMVEDMTVEISYEHFKADLIPQLALCKAMEQCGEVSSRIMKRWPEFVAVHPEIEFRRSQTLRHRIAHGYEGLDLETIWTTATTSIPAIRQAVRNVLAEIAPDERP